MDETRRKMTDRIQLVSDKGESMQQWGWGVVSVALLIFVSTYQNNKGLVVFSIILGILGIMMVRGSAKKERNSENHKDT